MKQIIPFLCAAAIAAAQVPQIGVVDFYGVHKVPLEKLRITLGVKPGDKIPSSKGDLEERLEQVPGVVSASIAAACCEDGKAILYVGIEEKGAPRFELRDAPGDAVALPLEIDRAYHHFVEELGEAVRKGETREDLSAGHSLIQNAHVREVQESFIELAKTHLERLREVLRSSADEEARAIAAYVIGYAPNKGAVVPDLQLAMRDPDPTVRSNAMRALSAVAQYAGAHPEAEIRVQLTWFVEMLNSLYWTDRHSAVVTLATFTEKRDAALATHLRERTMPALIEMARWKHEPHALPAFIVLGRVMGMEEKDIQNAWNKDGREALIRKAEASLKPAGGRK